MEYSRQASFFRVENIGFEKGTVTDARLLWIKSPIVNKKIIDCSYLIISICIAGKSYAFFRHIFDIYLYLSPGYLSSILSYFV